jgi:hypothetical protein
VRQQTYCTREVVVQAQYMNCGNQILFTTLQSHKHGKTFGQPMVSLLTENKHKCMHTLLLPSLHMLILSR